MNCKDAVASLIASLEAATPMSEEARMHLSGCDRCAALLDSAREFQASLHDNATLEPAVEPATSRAEDEVIRTRRRRLAARVTGVIAIAAVILALAAIALNAQEGGGPAPLEMLVIGFIITMIVGIPVLIVLIARAIVRPLTGGQLYKRLGPGRMLGGVALGIAEAAKLNVAVVRLIFLALFFVEGAGLIIYILLVVFMPVHPDDRQYLLRFKLRRWLGRSSASPGAG